MNAQEEYRHRLTSPEDAIKMIKTNDVVVLPAGVGAPPALMDAMADNFTNYNNVCFIQGVGMSKHRCILEEGMDGHFIKESIYHGPFDRLADRKNLPTLRVNPTMQISQANNYIYNRGVSVFMGTVSPMDKWGYFSLGTSVLYEQEAIEVARTVILEVNENMPRIHGDTWVHISQVDALVENNVPLFAIPNPDPSDKDKAIANYIKDLVSDRSHIQLGVGDIPNAVAKTLLDYKDLGVHTELLVDANLELWEAGVITNRYKPFHKGKIVACIALGSKKLYDFINDNPLVEFQRGAYTNNPNIIKLYPKLISVNMTLQIDLSGQCCSESLGVNQYSAIGGQLDWVRGAQMSTEGKSIIALYSTAKDDTISTIMPFISDGSFVTTPRTEVDYIVTEYGIARLKFKPIDERARMLIKLAHPKFRDQLTEDAKRLRIIR